MVAKDALEDVPGGDVLYVPPDRREDALDLLVADQALPEQVIFVDIMVEVVVDDGAIVAPGIAAEQFVAAGAAQHHLDELAGQLGRVEIRVALADARFLEM